MLEPGIFLIIGGILALSVVVAMVAGRLGVPSLVAFLGIGMLLGKDGIGEFSTITTEIAQAAGIIGLLAILFEGGLSTSFRRLRTVALPAITLSTIGVVVTAILAGAVSHYLFDLPWKYSLLLGAVVSSTDAAAVFATLRFTNIKRKLARVLEAETGGNDPAAIALTIGFISWIQHPDEGLGEMVKILTAELLIGLFLGLALGWVAKKIFANLPNSIGSFAPVVSIAACVITFGLTSALHGSGFLAVYLVGLAIGSTPSRYRGHLTTFHEGLAFIAQVTMFIVLGLFVEPHNLPAVFWPSIVLSLALIIFIRPIAVYLSVIGFKFTNNEKLLLGFAGLRGAVPIVLATFVLSADLPYGATIFNAVFFVVIISALIQGTTLEKVAKILKVTDVLPQTKTSSGNKLEKIRFAVTPAHSIAGVKIQEVGLPNYANITSIKRSGKTIKPTKDFIIKADDSLIITAPVSRHPEIEDVFSRWRRRI